MDAFGTGKKSRRQQLAATRQRRQIAVEPRPEPEPEPVPVPVPVAGSSSASDTSGEEDPLRPSTSATERKFRLMSGGAEGGHRWRDRQ